MTQQPAKLRDRYVVREAAADADVLFAVDVQADRLVAIKRFDLRAAKDWQQLESFERTCGLLQTIDHPLVPKHLDHFEQDGCLYLVMDHVDGQSLSERLATGWKMSEAEAWHLLDKVGQLLDQLHAMDPPVVHAGIGTRSILCRADGSLVVVGFGTGQWQQWIARMTDIGVATSVAPEQLGGQATAQSDVFALAVTVVTAMGGSTRVPFGLAGERVDLAAALPKASGMLRAVLTRMLEPEPSIRIRTVHDAVRPYLGRVAVAVPAFGLATKAEASLALPTKQASPVAWWAMPGGILTTVVLFVVSVPLWGALVLLVPVVWMARRVGWGAAHRWLMEQAEKIRRGGKQMWDRAAKAVKITTRN